MDMEFFANFNWAVPRALANAVGTCRFEQGDVLYSDRCGYESWPGSQAQLRYRLQVLDPPKTARALSPEQEGSRFAANWGSSIEFELTDRRSGETIRQVSTQGRVFSCLWRGTPEVLSEDLPAPEAPRGQRELHGRLEEAQAFVGERLRALSPAPLCVYLSAVDESSDAARLKAQAVEASLAESFPGLVSASFGPAEAGLDSGGELHPALMLRALGVQTPDPEAVEARLREALYSGTGSRFSLSRHGLLFGPLEA